MAIRDVILIHLREHPEDVPSGGARVKKFAGDLAREMGFTLSAEELEGLAGEWANTKKRLISTKTPSGD